MKKTLVSCSALVLLAGIAACSGTASQGHGAGITASHSALSGDGQKSAQLRGDLDLSVSFSLKTHKPGLSVTKDNHGSPEFRVLLKVDGRTIPLQASLSGENSEARGLTDSEAGDGIRYQFTGNLRLKEGTHTVGVEIPEDGIAVSREVALAAGEVNSLVIRPLYGTNPGMRRPGVLTPTSFRQGIKGVRLFLNGREI